MDKKHIREESIRAAWKERGRRLWNPKTHGKGLPLIIPAKQAGTWAATVAPLSLADNLEFRFYRARGLVPPFDYIVCEGVIVETWGEHEPPPFAIVAGDD